MGAIDSKGPMEPAEQGHFELGGNILEGEREEEGRVVCCSRLTTGGSERKNNTLNKAVLYLIW